MQMAMQPSSSNAIVGNCITQLHLIHTSRVNIVVFERDILPLTTEINTVLNQKIEIRVKGNFETIVGALEKELKLFNLLRGDVVSLLKLFKEVSRAKRFRLLLATVETNMCRKFHTDINDLRLLCTYAGPGTLWLEEDNVCRDALSSFGENSEIVLDQSRVKQVNTGAVAILKGAVYPLNGTNAVVHRSPAIEDFAVRRLVLRLDTDEFLTIN